MKLTPTFNTIQLWPDDGNGFRRPYRTLRTGGFVAYELVMCTGRRFNEKYTTHFSTGYDALRPIQMTSPFVDLWTLNYPQ